MGNGKVPGTYFSINYRNRFLAPFLSLDIEGPQNWCEGSIRKLAPWVWLQQSVIAVWYLTEGSTLPEAQEVEELMGPWDSKWSLRHMLQVLRRATLSATININSSDPTTLQQLVQFLKNCVLLGV
jgi:hypothetical protein